VSEMTTDLGRLLDLDFSPPRWVDTSGIGVTPPFTVVDLCCGSGGFTLGFASAGFVPLLGIESDRWAAETYHRNLLDVPLLESSVERLADAAISDATGGRPVDVVCAGLPCPGFSTNGLQRADDERNWLFTQLGRVVGLLQPHVVAIENVPAIESCHDGVFGRWIAATLADLGYGTVSLEVLNAAAYGVPQRRKRAVIVANRSGVRNPYPVPILSEPFFRTVDAAIGDLRGLPQGAAANHIWPVSRVPEKIAATPPGGSVSTFRGGCRRLRGDRPACTVTANHGRPHLHPHLHRTLSVREMARLQGFPDSFVFEGGISAQQDQVANAIPPPLAEHVALALRTLLDEVAAPAVTGHATDGDC